MDELIHELMHMGLSEKEAAVYLASLELGPAVVQDIAKKSGVNRATTYVMIESLGGRGLMSSYVKGKKRFFSSETPDRLLSIVHLQQKELTEKESEIRAVMPRLQALYNAEGERPQIRYMEGPEGIRAMQEIFEHMSGEYVQLFPADNVLVMHAPMKEREKHIEQLRRIGVSFRTLAVQAKPDFSRFIGLPGGEYRIVPKEQFPINGEITVRGNTIFLFSYTTAMLGIIITSKELADTARAMFNLAWLGAKEFPSKKIE